MGPDWSTWLAMAVLIPFPAVAGDAEPGWSATPSSANEYSGSFRAAAAALEAGRLAAARAGFERCASLAFESAVPRFYLACVEARAGNVLPALAELERAVGLGYGDAAVAEFEADLAPLRAEPEFGTLLERMRENARALPDVPRPRLHFRPDPERVGITPDESRAVALGSGVATLLDPRTGDTIALLAPSAGRRFVDVLLAPAGGRVALWDWRELRLFELDRGELLATLSLPGDTRCRVEFAARGEVLALHVAPPSSRETSTVTFYEAQTGERLGALAGVLSATVARGGRRVAAIEAGPRRGGCGVLWNLESGSRIASLTPAPPRRVQRCGFSDDGLLAWFITTPPHTLTVLDAVTGAELAVDLPSGGDDPWRSNDPRLERRGRRVRVTPEPHRHALAPKPHLDQRLSLLVASAPLAFAGPVPRVARGLSDASVQVLDLRTGDELARFDAGGRFLPMSWDPSGDELRGVIDRNRLAAFDTMTGAQVYAVDISDGRTNASFSPDGSRVVTYGHEQPTALYDARTGARVAVLGETDAGICEVGWSREGARLVTGTRGGSLQLRDARDGSPVGVPLEQGRRVEALALDLAHGRLVAGDEGGRAVVWSLVAGGVLHALEHDTVFDEEPLGTLLLDARGERVLTSVFAGWQVACWELATGRRLWLHDLGGGNEYPLPLAWAAGGARVLVGGDARVLDAETGELLAELPGLPESTPDGELMTLGWNPLGAVEVEGLRERWTRVERVGGAHVRLAPSQHYDGDGASGVELSLGQQSWPLDGCASFLLDPKRVRAAAAGVELAPIRLPPAPRVERVELERDANGAAVLTAEASGAADLAGFEVRLDGVLVPAEAATALHDGAKRAQLRLALPAAFGRAEVRARSRAGLTGRPRTLLAPTSR